MNVVIEGNVSLGDGVSIGANCIVRDAQIGAGARVLPFTHIDGAKCSQTQSLVPTRAFVRAP